MLTAFNWHVLYMLVISLIKKGKTVEVRKYTVILLSIILYLYVVVIFNGRKLLQTFHKLTYNVVSSMHHHITASVV